MFQYSVPEDVYLPVLLCLYIYLHHIRPPFVLNTIIGSMPGSMPFFVATYLRHFGIYYSALPVPNRVLCNYDM